MPLVHMKDMLQHAYQNGYAVGAFDLASLDLLDAVMSAAESAHAPVILNITEFHFDLELMMPAVETAARRASVPVAIHLDHGMGLGSAVNAIRLGCNSIMVNTSHLSLGENIDITRTVVEMAHACGVPVEGKLDCVSGMKDEDTERHAGAVKHATSAKAGEFVARTGIDFLAISIDAAHGCMEDRVKLCCTTLREMNAELGIPLAIHGGAGLTDDQFRELITLGVAKINYSATLSDLAEDSIQDAVKSGINGYTELLASVRAAASTEVERCMQAWGSAGRATEALARCRPWLNVEHVVVYNAPDLNEEKLRVIMSAGQNQLAAIPGVRRLEVGSVADKNARYRYCWLIRFASSTVIDSYKQHPAHVAFADHMFRPVAADRLTADYFVADVDTGVIALPITGETSVQAIHLPG